MNYRIIFIPGPNAPPIHQLDSDVPFPASIVGQLVQLGNQFYEIVGVSNAYPPTSQTKPIAVTVVVLRPWAGHPLSADFKP